jgi:ketosteroid isomerase-like protein
VEMPPNLPARNGVDAIKAAYASYFASGAHTDAFTMTAQEIGGSGGVAFDRGTWSWTGREGGAAAPVTESGKYLGIARRQADGSWRYTDMIWNTDQPPAPPPAPQ